MINDKKKKVLIVIADFSPTTLKAVKRLLFLDFQVTILSSYNFNSIPEWFKYIRHKLFRNLYKRKRYAKKVLGKDISLVKVISGHFWYIWPKSIFQFVQEGVVIENIHRNYVQNQLIDKIDFKEFDAIYLFDTYALNFQQRAKEVDVKNILQSRGMHFKYSLEVNKKMNQLFNTSVEDVDSYVKDIQSEAWYNKLLLEPKNADFMLFYSEFHRNVFCEYSDLNVKNSVIIPINVGISKSDKVLTCDGAMLKFLYVGNLSYVKGIPVLIEAFENLRKTNQSNLGVELHLFGASHMPEIAEMMRGVDNIIYHGVIDNQKLMQKLQDFHVFVFPSLFDTFGMALAEALQMNLPVISNYTCGAAELFTDKLHGVKYSDSYNANQLMQAMKEFLDNPELVEFYSKNLSNLSSFTETYISEKYKDELNKLKMFIEEN